MISNLTQQTTLAQSAREAHSFWWRLRGMMLRRFEGFDALLFRRCGSIHTCFMLVRIDIVFLDKEDRVLQCREGLRPWRIAAAAGAKAVLELPAGVIEATCTQAGDQIKIDEDILKA